MYPVRKQLFRMNFLPPTVPRLSRRFRWSKPIIWGKETFPVDKTSNLEDEGSTGTNTKLIKKYLMSVLDGIQNDYSITH